jgi:16S rRNA (guanine1207-N2)-methyltransferase
MNDPGAGGGQQHYFSAQPQRASAPRQIAVTVRGLRLNLDTDRGVFSYGELDRGSKLLAETMVLPERGEILDWGAGYGVLGIVAALLCPQCDVYLAEVNERAAALAQANLEAAGIANATVLCGEAPAVLGDRRLDAIISNPPLHAGRLAVEAVIEEAGRRLRPGGELWLVVPTRKGARGFFELMVARFAEARVVTISGGFRILWARQGNTSP